MDGYMQRKTSKTTRGPNKAEKDFQAWLKQQPCCVTGQIGVQVHHCKGATYKHNKVLIGHWFCLPLSPEVHAEYHAGTKAWKAKYGTQSSFWLDLVERYENDMQTVVDPDVYWAISNCNQ